MLPIIILFLAMLFSGIFAFIGVCTLCLLNTELTSKELAEKDYSTLMIKGTFLSLFIMNIFWCWFYYLTN